LKIDADNQIAESNETNNVLVSTSTIRVSAAVATCPPQYKGFSVSSNSSCSNVNVDSTGFNVGYSVYQRTNNPADGFDIVGSNVNFGGTVSYVLYLRNGTTTPPSGLPIINCSTGAATNNWLYFTNVTGNTFNTSRGSCVCTPQIVTNGVVQVGVGAHGTDANGFGVYVKSLNGSDLGIPLAIRAYSLTPNCTNCSTDNIAPTLTCPNDTTIVTTQPTGSNFAYIYRRPTATDNCSPYVSIYTNSAIPISVTVGSTQTITYTAVDPNGNQSTCNFKVTVNSDLVPSTYCASKGVAPWEYAISNVSFGTLNNTSDKFKDFNTLGYSDYTNLSTTLTKGQTYPLSITPLLSWIGNLPNAYARVWIDFNQNKTFEANELVLEKTNANPLTQNVLVPSTALTGATRMRVSLKNGTYPTACETFDKGEVEDYTVTIADGTIVNNSCRFQDSLQLVSLYNATNGPNWINKWNLATPINTWFGVRLSAQDCVERISLISNGLNGTIPNLSLANLDSLELLGNRFSSVPNFNALPKITLLKLSSNQMTGAVPNLNLPTLKVFVLLDNQLSGTIPNFVLPNLVFLSLGNNPLSGTIPNFNLPNLESLFLNDNQLTGTIPNFNLPKLAAINFQNNKLTGSIPDFANALGLQNLIVKNNQLSGCLPLALKYFCGRFNVVDLTLNPNLATQDFTAFCGANSTGACQQTTSDIALTITGDPSVYRQYSTQNFRVSAKNNGSTAFTNVKIKFTRPALTVSGGTKVASVGTFQDFCPNSVECSEWTIPTLAANTTATLDVPVYVLNPTAAIVASTNLIASTPVDNVTANNTASVSINRSTTPAVQPLILSKPSQQIPIVIQSINPTITENYIVVELESIVDKQIEFHILNSLGTMVLTEKMAIEKGNNKRQFDVSQLPKGLYLIQTSVGQGRNVPMKFVKY
jgi:hypothetical protein